MCDVSDKTEYDLYRDINNRTSGEVYIGVVGPVRTGKSTFVKRFMEMCVIPQIADEDEKIRAIDELPLSSDGQTVMTTEPKFIPKDGASIKLSSECDMKIRLIDCVGFMVEGALGAMENGEERQVKTPWFEETIPFSKAAKIGTQKVITDHSTIGIVVTTDGSFTGIERNNYILPEKQTIEKLKSINKPFVVVLNCQKPYSKEINFLAAKMEEEYKVRVIPANCEQLREEDIKRILRGIIDEFPITQICVRTPAWVEMLKADHWLKADALRIVEHLMENIDSIKDVKKIGTKGDEYVTAVTVDNIETSTGKVNIHFEFRNELYYQIISEMTGVNIDNEYEMINLIKRFAIQKRKVEQYLIAAENVENCGFGIITPDKSEIKLDEPIVIKNGNKYGVKLKAKVPSVNMLKADIVIEIAPIVGNKTQAEDLMEYIRGNMNDNSDGIWDTNIFGKTVGQIIDDGIIEKTHNITQENMYKISDTLEKVMNENNGLVCFIV